MFACVCGGGYKCVQVAGLVGVLVKGSVLTNPEKHIHKHKWHLAMQTVWFIFSKVSRRPLLNFLLNTMEMNRICLVTHCIEKITF